MERMDQLFTCNDVESEDKKRALFLMLIGPEAYGTLKDIVSPALPSSKTYSQLKQHSLLHGAHQEVNENIKSYESRLKNLSQYCAFGTFLEEALRDKLVCGVWSESIKRKLLSEDNLSWTNAYNTTVAIDTVSNANLQVNELGPRKVGSPRDTRLVRKGSRSPQGTSSKRELGPCFRCNRKHNPDTCPAKSWECFRYHKKGHTSRVCHSSGVRALEEEDEGPRKTQSDEEDLLELGFIAKIEKYSERMQKANMSAESKPVEFEVDSGACRTVIHLSTFKKLFSTCELFPVEYKLKAVTDQNVKIIVMCEKEVVRMVHADSIRPNFSSPKSISSATTRNLPVMPSLITPNPVSPDDKLEHKFVTSYR
nr:unnamed protein product [Callosobruchus analis]